MSDQTQAIEGFLQRLRHWRLRSLWWRTLAWTCCAISAAALLIGLSIIATGRRVPLELFYGAVVAIPLLSLVAWFVQRPDRAEIARLADDTYGLHDTLRSFLGFRASRAEGPMYALQTRATANAISDCNPRQITVITPPRLWVWGALVAGLAIALLLVDESTSRRDARLQAEVTTRKTAEIKAILAEMAREIDDEEATSGEHGDHDLTELIEQIDATADPELAMRQYAELERQLRERLARMTPKDEQQLLDRAAEELKRSPESRELGEKLEHRDYDKAAETLAELTPDPAPENAKPLDKQRAELARMKAVAQRLAQAGRQQSSKNLSKQGGSNSSGSSGKGGSSTQSTRGGESGQSGKAGDPSTGDNDPNDQALDELLAQLEDDVLDAEDALDEAQRQFDRLQKIDPDLLERCNSTCKNLAQSSNRLGERLKRVASRNRSSNKLERLRRQLGQCQSYLSDAECESLAALLMQSNGLNPGSQDGDNPGHADDPEFAGGADRVRGIKGSGPSQVSVEAAESGDAVTSRRSVARARSFDRQVEAFVAREDIPDDLKSGVKTYFQTIHEHDVAPQEPTGEHP